jgi:hypothetical protein
VKLAYTQRTTTATAKGTAGLVNYLNNTPLYMDAFYSIYTYSKILAVDMHIEVINLDTVPYEFVLTTMPQGGISAVTVDQVKESRGAIVKVVGGSSGMNKVVLRKHYNVEEVVGYHLADRDTRMTLIDANSSSYADSSLPAIVFFPSLITGAATNGVCITVIQTYHLCFFDIQVPPVSALKSFWPDPPLKEEEMEESCSFEELKEPSNNTPRKEKTIAGDDEIYIIEKPTKLPATKNGGHLSIKSQPWLKK